MKGTQNEAILAELERGRKLTSLDALRRFNCLRLGARIYDLKRAGHQIESRLIHVGDARVAEYKLGGI